MKRLGGLVAVTLLLFVFALVEVRMAFAQVQRRTVTYTDGSRYEGEILNGKRHGLGTYVYSDGGRYAGDWRDGRKHGHGTYTWTDGTRHVGELRSDKFHGRGIRTWPNGNLYSGDWRDGKMHGRGTYIWADGTRHMGEFRNDNFHGRGTRTWPNGNRYEGGWRGSKMHGQGTFTWANGTRHVGQVRNGDFHGRGTRTWSNGNRYEGDWRADKMHGRGTFAYPNGNGYEGDWRDNRMHGQGTYTWADGGRYVGELRNDKFHGRGTRTWSNGHHYEGEWHSDKKHGQGTYTWQDGGRYAGEWRDGKKHGRGTRAWPDGRRYEGQWRNDRMHGRGTMIRADGSSYEGEWRDGRRSDRPARERQGQVRQQVRARNTEGRSQRQRNPSDPKAEERGLALTQAMRKQIQSCLKMQGFDPGPSDGLIGPRTRAAIRSWQVAQSHGQREAGGYLSEGDLSALLAGCQVAEQRELTPEKQTERPAHESQGQRETTEAPELQRQDTDYWSELQRRRRQEQSQATSTQREMERQRQTQQQARERQQQRAVAQSRQQTESVDSTELFRWLKQGESSETRAKILDLLNRGADPNVVDEYGNTPLHYAALASFGEDVLQALIAAGGRCGTGNAAGETPLHHTVNNMNAEFPQAAFIQTLVACGANPSAQDAEGNTPLHMVFLPLADSYEISPSGGTFNDFWGDGGADTLRSLLTNGSNPDIKNRAGDSPLMIALREKTGIMGVRTLLAHGADPNTVDAHGTPALVQSILDYYGHTRDRTAPIPVIEMLIKAGADPNASTPQGATALHHQLDTAGGSGPIAQTLIALGANPNAQDQRGDTPLHWYVRQPGRGSRLLATLIDSGADPCIQNHNGNTPLDVSADHDYEDHLPECARPDTREHDATTLASAKEAEAERKRWKSLGLVMVRVEGGNFVMGCNEKETSYDYCSHDEKPAHRVRLQSFEIGKYEVTQALWEVVMRNSPSYHKNCPKCPVENVSWAEVQAFLRELNTLTGSAYRLPTEAEWEFAARGGLRSRGYTYAGGHESDIVAWNGNSERSGSQPVGEKQGNELGLYDLSGNVWEWVKDCWNGNYNGAPTDGRAWEQGDCEYRVIRGGSFCYAPDHIFVRNPWSGCTTGSRPDGAKDVGFRLARTIVQ